MAKKQRLLRSIFESLGKPVDFVTPAPGQRLRLSGRRLGMALPSQPIEIELGEERLHVQKEIRCDGSPTTDPATLLVYNPDLDPEQITYSLRLKPGQTLHISHNQPYQEHLFRIPREAFRRNFQLEYANGNLLFRDPISELGSFVMLLEKDDEQCQILSRRRDILDKIALLNGGPLEILPPPEALNLLQQVTHLLRNDAFRKSDETGVAGGLLELPAEISPIIIGDLHANINNLLKLLCENSFMRALETGTGALVFLGDLVQPDTHPYDDMDSSVLMMDFLLKLKLHFPNNVFFLRGNHDSFSVEVAKEFVPQGVLWRKKLEQIRGMEYCEQMTHFYDLCPVVAMSKDFVACHAGPPPNKIEVGQLINIRNFPDLLHDLTWNRIRRPGHPSGYSGADVRRLRKSLKLNREHLFLVSHTPYSDTETLWCNVAGIPNHHILYSARDDEFAVFTRVNGQLVPQIYAGEPVSKWLNIRAKNQ